MKRVCWVSQHKMAHIQLETLKRMYGIDVDVVPDPRPFDGAETIVQRIRAGGFDDCVVVAPYSVLARMVDLGLRPLWSEAEQVLDQASADWSVKGRHYKFLRFRRVKALILDLEDLGSSAERPS